MDDQRALIRQMQVVVTEQHEYIRAALAEVNDQRELRRVSLGSTRTLVPSSKRSAPPGPPGSASPRGPSG
jgi:hypothetical protein